MTNFLAEKKGRTLHLLKESSKPAAQERKRKKIEIACTPASYREAHGGFQQPDEMMKKEDDGFKDISKLVIRKKEKEA